MDEHLVTALRGWGPATVAVSVWPGMGEEAIIQLKLSLRKRLPDLSVLYFDSTTHPLGDPALQVAEARPFRTGPASASYPGRPTRPRQAGPMRRQASRVACDVARTRRG